jgi:predicted nucleic acid-binding protein
VSAVYDSVVLIAAERNDRAMWADHRIRLELGLVPITTAPVVAQVSRSARQVQLRRLLRGCDIVGFEPSDSHEVGELLSRAGSSDVVEAHVVLTASRSGSAVLTADDDDLNRLSNSLRKPVLIRRVGAGGVKRRH